MFYYGRRDPAPARVPTGGRSVTQLGFWSIAQADPDRLALVDPDEHPVTAGALLASCNQVVHGLRALGLRPGDAVAMLLPNGTEVFECYLAVLQAGFYLVPINWHLVGPEVAYIVADCEAKAFVAHARFADTAKAAADEIGLPEAGRFAVGGAIESFRPYEDLKAGQPTTAPADRTTGLVMNYTSGTTGRPKGVRRPRPEVVPEEQAVGFAGMLFMFRLAPFDANVHICGSPLYHTAVLVFAGGAIHLGHTVVIMDKWTPEGMLALIDRYRVTSTHMVPTQFVRLLGLPAEERDRFDVSSLRHMVHAAAPCPPEIKRAMLEWWGPVIDEYYAASEGGGTIVFADEWLERPGTVGRAWSSSEVVILDDDGNELPAGQIGTVYMHMRTGDFEYFKDRAKTDDSRRGRFFTVGDVGYLDDDGWLFLSDRKNDMIISGGANIYPAEIESVLIMHPRVADVAVFGIPHPDWGEEVKAVVEPIDGATGDPALAADILAWAADKLAKYKTPRSIDFVAELPRDPNGKLYKRRLRDPYWEGHERAI
ncbi:MAG: acyl-CoA synthetase [Actinobacteria bacterium]|nr:acyl-CoA synthetase [Actinomycetota bacterium]